MMGSISLVTPSHRGDLDRFALLAESVDRYVHSFVKHYAIVNDEDLPLFTRFQTDQRAVLPVSQFLPRWLRAVPPALRWRKRRVWWSFRAKPVHGWHVQQIAKIRAAATLPEERYCMIDSDVIFYRPFDAGALARPNPSPLLIERLAIAADAPLHARWVRNAHRLLGLSDPVFPADDHIGNIIVWDQATVRAMTARIETVTARAWQEALCRDRGFSEYLLYGNYVSSDADARAKHTLTERSFSVNYGDDRPLDAAALRALLLTETSNCVALGVQSFSDTPVEIIRSVLAEFSGNTHRAA
jgi:hypothetical protein